jgi:hypothetical protein
MARTLHDDHCRSKQQRVPCPVCAMPCLVSLNRLGQPPDPFLIISSSYWREIVFSQRGKLLLLLLWRRRRRLANAAALLVALFIPHFFWANPHQRTCPSMLILMILDLLLR